MPARPADVGDATARADSGRRAAPGGAPGAATPHRTRRPNLTGKSMASARVRWSR